MCAMFLSCKTLHLQPLDGSICEWVKASVWRRCMGAVQYLMRVINGVIQGTAVLLPSGL